MSNEQRTYLRVPTRIKAYGRHVSNEDSLPVFAGCMAAGNENIAAKLKDSKLAPELIDFLLEMNTKLDTLLTAQNISKLREEFPLTIEIQEISGAGVQFRSHEPVREGDRLEIVMELAQFPIKLVGAMGSVLRCEDCENSSAWAFEFTNIRDADQEEVVQFVFQQQRAQIRDKKWR